MGSDLHLKHVHHIWHGLSCHYNTHIQRSRSASESSHWLHSLNISLEEFCFLFFKLELAEFGRSGSLKRNTSLGRWPCPSYRKGNHSTGLRDWPGLPDRKHKFVRLQILCQKANRFSGTLFGLQPYFYGFLLSTIPVSAVFLTS